MDDLPNPNSAERNQQRKLAFIPMWPVLGALLLFVVLYLVFRWT
jgi:hypothetical protein